MYKNIFIVVLMGLAWQGTPFIKAMEEAEKHACFDPFHLDVAKNHLVKIVNQLADQPHWVVIPDEATGALPLNLALTHGHHVATRHILTVMKKEGLLQMVNTPDSSGYAPLHWVFNTKSSYNLSEQEIYPFVSLLLEYEADPNVKATNGITPLHLAAARGYSKIAHLLIERGARVDAVPPNGQTPLHCGALQGHQSVVGLLLEHEAPVNARDVNNQTPLHYVAQSLEDHPFIAHMLLNWHLAHAAQKMGSRLALICNSADNREDAYVDARDRYYKRPLDYAVKGGLKGVREILVKNGSVPNSLSS